MLFLFFLTSDLLEHGKFYLCIQGAYSRALAQNDGSKSIKQAVKFKGHGSDRFQGTRYAGIRMRTPQ